MGIFELIKGRLNKLGAKGNLFAFAISLLLTITCLAIKYYLAMVGGILVSFFFLTEIMHIDFPDDERNI